MKSDAQPHQPVIQPVPVSQICDKMSSILADLGDYQDSSNIEPEVHGMTRDGE